MANDALAYTTAPGKRDGTTILKLTGPLTLTTMFSFQDEFRQMRPPALILDLSDSPYMDSAGLGLVVNQHVSAENGGRRFLLAGVNHRIMALFDMTKVTAVLAIFSSVAEAEASL